jgi:shikimate dehydrogenase
VSPHTVPVASLRFAVLGDPIAHSKSPAMHTAAYRALALPHSYDKILAKIEDLPRLVGALRDGTYAGFNVTVPHKKRILELVDVIDSTAAVVDAANTLVRAEDGRIHAFNTDTPALADELRELAPENGLKWGGRSALVLGTGGAARSAVVALAVDLGVSVVHVRGRSLGDPEACGKARADLEALVRKGGSNTRIVTGPLAPDRVVDGELSAVVQATSAGMTGADSGEELTHALDFSALGPRAVCLDVVYAPPSTPFLKVGEAHGLRCANGLGMLVRQGALAFELWLRVPAPYNAMLAAIT